MEKVKETKRGGGPKIVKKGCWLRVIDGTQGEVQASFESERVGSRWEDTAQKHLGKLERSSRCAFHSTCCKMVFIR